jgi:transketolase N-terminal domain/subunit
VEASGDSVARRQHLLNHRGGVKPSTSSLSAADLMAVLLASHLRSDLEQPRALGNDQLISSKGHAAPLPYAVLKAA